MIDVVQFQERFLSLTKDWDWEVQGFIDKKNYVYPIDLDTKVISTVFERLASPVIRKIAKDENYIVEIANQTTYPDFTLTLPEQAHRIAIDVKTTYKTQRNSFTLGGYNSFIRHETKNILHPYSSYHDHWVIGFIYEQLPRFEEYDLDRMPNAGDIGCPRFAV